MASALFDDRQALENVEKYLLAVGFSQAHCYAGWQSFTLQSFEITQVSC